MDVISASADHDEAIRDVASRAIRASYSLSPEQITALVDQEFSDERIEQRRSSDQEITLIASDDGELVGVVTGRVDGDDGEIDWLFVAPEARGREIGTRLFEAAREKLQAQGADAVWAIVMSENEEGEQFFEQFGYERIGHQEVELDGETHAAQVYGPHGADIGGEPHRPETVDTEDGTVYTGDDDLQGKEAPFLALYTDEDRTQQYGFFCTNCGTVANAADGLERVDCDTCGNESRPDEWDSGYL